MNSATLQGPLTSKDFAGAGFATGTMYSIYRDPKLSEFLAKYLREVLEKQPGVPMTVTHEDHEGVPAIRLSLGSEDKIMEAWWFDPARGMAQLGYRHSGVTPGGKKMISVELRVTKLSEIAPKLWYPLEAFRYWIWYPEPDDHFAGPSRTPEEARRREHYLAKKAVANSPTFDPAVFSPPIPQGYRVTDRSRDPTPTTMMGTGPS